MWWKIYFWIIVILDCLSILSLFDHAKQNIFLHCFLILATVPALFGLYSYAFKKHNLSKTIWKYVFLYYLIFDAVYFLIGFLPPAYLKYVAYLLVYPDYSVPDALIDTAIDIPFLYALFKLSKGELYEPKAKKKTKKNTRFHWGMIQMALWGYSSILTFCFFVLAFFPQGDAVDTKQSVNPFFIMMVSPLLIFWLWVLLGFKQYKWNWWRTTLIANAILYSGSIMFGMIFPQPQSETTGFDIISVLQLCILLVSYYVFGKEQFLYSDKES
ncbi:MAG TPA: hypothetical protein VND99_04915 [Candidatus Acidoferrales bacterium]|nr:hypothetical protein [Candidatus Acidoferrales bacterium]